VATRDSQDFRNQELACLNQIEFDDGVAYPFEGGLPSPLADQTKHVKTLYSDCVLLIAQLTLGRKRRGY
jgi:hypothetical protein